MHTSYTYGDLSWILQDFFLPCVIVVFEPATHALCSFETLRPPAPTPRTIPFFDSQVRSGCVGET